MPRPSAPVGAPAPRAPPSRRNVAYVPTLTAAAALRVKAALSKAAWWLWHLTFDLESGVRVKCDVGYLSANFGLPRPLCSRLRPDVRNRQTSDVRQKHRLMPQPIRGGDIIKVFLSAEFSRMAVTIERICRRDMQVRLKLSKESVGWTA